MTEGSESQGHIQRKIGEKIGQEKICAKIWQSVDIVNILMLPNVDEKKRKKQNSRIEN